jgi:acetyl esterase/lipase
MKKPFSKMGLLTFMTIMTSMAMAACGDSPTATTQPTTTAPATTNSLSSLLSEKELTFTSGNDTLYGTLLVPQGASGKLPATLLIAGSGPTDRDGNSKLLQGETNTLKDFAHVLGAQGIVSFRYDKLGSGKTGLASHTTNLLDIGFDTFMDEAMAAYNLLKSRPEVDPQRIMILGNSEGGLFALVMADQLKANNGVKAVLLAAPLGSPYLDLIKRQLTEQYQQAVQLGQFKKEEADAALAELDQINKSLLETGKYPATINTPALKQLYTPANEKFWAQVSKYDPGKLAAGLPASFPALVLRGAKDSQVAAVDVQNVMQGFQKAGNNKVEFHELVNVNHVFKEVPGTPNPLTDYVNPAFPFSKEASQFTVAFVKANL